VKRIVIATDGSAGGRAAVESGIELARGVGAIATFVHVRHAPLPIFGDPDYQQALSAELPKTRVVIEEAVARADNAGRTRPSRPRLRSGPARRRHVTTAFPVAAPIASGEGPGGHGPPRRRV